MILATLFLFANTKYYMNFKEWLIQSEGGMVAQGKAQASLFKPGPRDIKHKPHDDIRICGASGGPASCQAGGGAAPVTK